MMAVVFLSQNLISRIDRPQHPFSAQCVEHAEMMWSGVRLCAPHLQLQGEAKPYLYKDDQKRPMPVHKWLSFTNQDRPDRTRLKSLEATLGMKS